MTSFIRFLRLPRGRRALVARSWAKLAGVRIELVFRSYGRVRTQHGWRRDVRRRAGRAELGDPGRLESTTWVRDVAWSVPRAARFVPGASCLVQALAAERLLRTRGLAPTVRVGVLPHTSGAFEAHAWLELDGEIVVGDRSDLDRYRLLPEAPSHDLHFS